MYSYYMLPFRVNSYYHLGHINCKIKFVMDFSKLYHMEDEQKVLCYTIEKSYCNNFPKKHNLHKGENY